MELRRVSISILIVLILAAAGHTAAQDYYSGSVTSTRIVGIQP